MSKNKLKEYDTSLTTSSTTGGGTGANVTVQAKDLQKVGPSLSKMKGVNVKVVGEEAEAVIEPQDHATIKYLSNVKDEQNKTSQPFNIGGKQYQMVRGITPEKQIVLGVYCFDDLNESGENVIHPVDHFEKTIAGPMRETMETSMNEKKEVKPETKPTEQPKDDNPDSLRLGDFKHFIVDETTGKFKKFQNIQDLAKYPMSDNEKYMGLSEFKKFFHNKVFGGSQKQGLNEVTPTGQETDEDMNAKAKKLMVMISKRIPSIVIETIKKNKVAQREVIAAFAELIGVPRAGLGNLVSGIKDLAKTSTQQQQGQTQPEQGQMPPEQDLAPISENRKVVKTIKIKDIK